MTEKPSVSVPTLVTFAAGASGAWVISDATAVYGAPLVPAPRLTISTGRAVSSAPESIWALRGVVSNMRYTTAAEAKALVAKQDPLGRAGATHAALIPIRKSAVWWSMPQDERRAIYEEQSRHTTIGLEYLPQIARRLHHSRDLGEPFDFLTWFEFAPEHESAFDELLARMRASEEWRYVEREVDIRLTRAD